jgi:hypothetical protein
MRVVGRQAEQAARIIGDGPDRLEDVDVHFLGHEADDAPRGADTPLRVSSPFSKDRPGRRRDDATDGVDQRGLARAIGAEQGEDLALTDIEIDVLERLEPALVGLAEAPDRQNGWHAAEVPRRCCYGS